MIKPGTWKLNGERKDLKKKLNNTHSERLKHRIREEYTNKNVEIKKATKRIGKFLLRVWQRKQRKLRLSRE